MGRASFGSSFDAVVALHACGALTDLALDCAVTARLPFAISPCCVGKVLEAPRVLTGTARRMPLSSQQRSAPPENICYPRSAWLRDRLTADEYALLAAQADYGGKAGSLLEPSRCKLRSVFLKSRLLLESPLVGGIRLSLSCCARREGTHTTHVPGDDARLSTAQRRAKRVVETDRLEACRERGYFTRLLDLSADEDLHYPKRELLLGAPIGSLAATAIAALPTNQPNFKEPLPCGKIIVT